MPRPSASRAGRCAARRPRASSTAPGEAADPVVGRDRRVRRVRARPAARAARRRRHRARHVTAPRDRPDESELAADEPGPPPPSRPVAVELAAALLIVGGVISLIGGISSIPGLPPGTEPLFAVTVALDDRLDRGRPARPARPAVARGRQLRGRARVPGPARGRREPAVLDARARDILVVVILFRHKPWFDALPRGDDAAAERPTAQPLTPPTARPPTR